MAVRTVCFMLCISMILLNGCSNDVLGPGDVARPLVGSYTLESRSVIAQDSAATLLNRMNPPELRGFLSLSSRGRYAHADTLVTASIDTIFLDTGQWSVNTNQFFIQSDTRGSSSEVYTFDGVRLIRTIPDIPDSRVPGGAYKVVDVWMKR